MTVTTLDDFVTMQDAEVLVKRSGRSLQRDINEALSMGKDNNDKPDILQNVILLLTKKDSPDVIRPGVEVEPGDAEKARDQDRKKVTWYLNRNWIIQKYGLREGDARSAQQESTQAENEPKATPPENESPKRRQVDAEAPPLPDDPLVRAVVLEHLHYYRERHTVEKDDLTDQVLKLVKSMQTLQEQSNVLYKQLQESNSPPSPKQEQADSDDNKKLSMPPSDASKNAEGGVIDLTPLDGTDEPDSAEQRKTQPKHGRSVKTTKMTTSPNRKSQKKKPAKKQSTTTKAKSGKKAKKESNWERIKRLANLRIG